MKEVRTTYSLPEAGPTRRRLKKAAYIAGALATTMAVALYASNLLYEDPRAEVETGFVAVDGDKPTELVISGAGPSGLASNVRSSPRFGVEDTNLCGIVTDETTVTIPAGQMLAGEGGTYDGPALNDINNRWVAFPIDALPKANRSIPRLPLIHQCNEGYVYVAETNVTYESPES